MTSHFGSQFSQISGHSSHNRNSMGVLRARVQVGFNVKKFFYVTLGCYFLFINVIVCMVMHAYVYSVNRVGFACLAGKLASSSHKSQRRAYHIITLYHLSLWPSWLGILKEKLYHLNQQDTSCITSCEVQHPNLWVTLKPTFTYM